MFKKYKEIRPWVEYLNMSNTVISWVPTDSKERYESNMREHSKRMHELGWDDLDRISYRINSEKFRGDDFAEGGAMFLGCSFTYGTGIPEENIWTTIVARKLGLHCNNLGFPGASNNSMFRLADKWIPKLKPKKVFMLSTHKERLEVFHNRYPGRDSVNDIPHNYLPGNIGSQPHVITAPKWYFDTWLADDRNSELNERKNILAIEMLCHKNNCQFTHIAFDPETNDLRARDLMHPGVEWHQQLANEFLQKMT